MCYRYAVYMLYFCYLYMLRRLYGALSIGYGRPVPRYEYSASIITICHFYAVTLHCVLRMCTYCPSYANDMLSISYLLCHYYDTVIRSDPRRMLSILSYGRPAMCYQSECYRIC